MPVADRRRATRKRCRRCGEEHPLEVFPMNGGRHHSWCRPCYTAYLRDRRQRLHDSGWRRPPSLGERYAQIRRSAEVRHLSFTLTREELGAFWEQPCHYCGGLSPGVGLDRVDNTCGYEPGNVVPCCGLCNSWKLDLSEAAFREHLGRVSQHYLLGRPQLPLPVTPLLAAAPRRRASTGRLPAGRRRHRAGRGHGPAGVHRRAGGPDRRLGAAGVDRASAAGAGTGPRARAGRRARVGGYRPRGPVVQRTGSPGRG